MKISKQEVEHVARLARLELAEAEKDKLIDQLSNILTYVETLNGLDTKGVEPTSHVLDIKNVMRDDVSAPSLSQDQALANAPEKAAGHFKVPKIIE
jgi:aspartyl-tRNA(Asn)/glutamyl-tRNA(Gln) amidotransferase subunit C